MKSLEEMKQFKLDDVKDILFEKYPSRQWLKALFEKEFELEWESASYCCVNQSEPNHTLSLDVMHPEYGLIVVDVQASAILGIEFVDNIQIPHVKTLDELIDECHELAGSIPYLEYYSHDEGDCWKINNPFTHYNQDKRVLCKKESGLYHALQLAIKEINLAKEEHL